MALCPAHDDRTPSLSVSEGPHGKALAKCFAGCKFEDIRDALGLTPPRNSNGHAPSNPLPSRAQAKSPPAPRPLPEGAGTQIWVYDYHDGTPAFAVERRDPGKHFKQWTPAPDHLWIPVGLPAPRPLYQLQAILESESPVLVVEGEGCADAAQDAWPGMVVTTWSGGAASWRESEWYVLADREVILVADGDPLDVKGLSPGHEAMKGVADVLRKIGSRVSLALPPQDGSDVADWLTTSDADTVWAAIERMSTPVTRWGALYDYARTVDLDNLSDAPTEPALLQRDDGATVIYAGKTSSLHGPPGVGKSFLALRTAQEAMGNGGRVVWLDFEDSPKTLARRANRIGARGVADKEAFLFLQSPNPKDDQDGRFLDEARRWLVEGTSSPEYCLVTLDSAEAAGAASDGGDIAGWWTDHVRPWEMLGVTVLVLDHVAKRREGRPRGPIGSTHKLSRVTGAGLFIDGTPWNKTVSGTVKLRNDKDRPGELPAPLGRWVADVRGSYDHDGNFLLEITAPAEEEEDTDEGRDSPRAAIIAALTEAGPEGIKGKGMLASVASITRPTLDKALPDLLWENGGRVIQKVPERSGGGYSYRLGS